jgi:integrase
MQAPSSQKTPRNQRVERGIYRRQTLNGPRWEYCYPNGNGGSGWETVRSLSAARKGRARMIAQVDRGEPVIRRSKVKGAESLEEWFEWKSPRLRKRTADYYRRALDLVLLPRFGGTPIQRIDADAVAKLIRDLEREGLHCVDPGRPVRPLGRSSIDNYLKPLQQTLKRAVRKGQLVTNPFDVLGSDERPKKAETEQRHEWTSDEVDALLAASERLAAKKEARFDYSLLLRVVVTLGLRLGEVLGLRWEDFDKDGGYLHVRRQWLRSGEYGPTKTPAGVRHIALPPELRHALREHRVRSRFSADEDPIFASRIGTPLSHRNCTRRGWVAARDEAKLPKSVSFHDLRGAAASRLIDAGLDVVTVAEIVGHGDRGATLLKHYAGRFDKQRKDDAVRVALAVTR